MGVVGSVGEAGTGGGAFDVPAGVAVEQASGDLYVADARNQFGQVGGGHRVQQLTSGGDFVRTWGWGVATGTNGFEVCSSSCQGGIAGPGAGQLSLQAFDDGGNFLVTPQVAVDQSDGSVYVADPGNDRVQKFNSSGALVGQLGVSGTGDGELNLPQGVAVDPVSGDVYVADSGNNRVQRFASNGVYQSQIGAVAGGSGDGEFVRPTRVAVDSAGLLYVLDVGNSRVQRFTAGGTFDLVFALGAMAQPVDLTVDTVDDHVYISGTNSDLSINGIFEFDSAGQGVDTHAANTGVFSFDGLGVESSTGRIYASDPFGHRVLVLDEVTPPTAAIDAVSDVTAQGATFHGLVNPHGPPNTRYRFEYSVDGAGWNAVPSSDVPVGEGTSDVTVSETSTGLEPNTQYRVRLVATKDFNAGTTVSGEVTFTTDTAPPRVRPLAAGSRSSTAAWLGAEVNPQNSSTGYYVEYTLATDVDYASSSRVPSQSMADVGGGNEFTTVRQLVSGLKPDTAYRFRVVATNEAGTAIGPDGTFATLGPLPEAPAGRGYEMVSPLDKNGGDVDRNLPSEFLPATSGASASGDAVAYASQAQFAGILAGALQGQYRSVRRSDRWVTRAITPPVRPQPSEATLVPTVEFLSEDLSQAVVSTNSPLVPGADALLGGSWGLYLQDNTGTASDYRLLSDPISPLPAEIGVPKFRFSFAGASRDMRHVVFEAKGRQLVPGGPPIDDGATGVYEWDDGQVRLVSVLPSGVPASTAMAGTGVARGLFSPGGHVVSDDGGRVFFTELNVAGNSGPLYVREGGTSTRAVSGSDNDPSVARDATFLTAKASDGSMALFTSRHRLTDDATAADGSCRPEDPIGGCHDDMYLWNAAGPADERLKDLTTGDLGGGGVSGIAGAAEDLSYVYFVASGVLADGGAAGAPNLYMWSAESGVRFVARLNQEDGSVWSTTRNHGRQFRDGRVSADGSKLLFASRARLTVHDTAEHKQVYLYDAETDRLSCVSCSPVGSVSTGDAWLLYPAVLGASSSTEAPHAPYRLPRNLSADGARVVFETAEGLVGEDANGKVDVYLWSDGELSLVSTGKAADGAEFVDASANGRDIFFTTRERLVGSDTDDQVDVYDARVGGGFAEPQIPPPCISDECQGPPTVRPVLPPSGSGVAALELPKFRWPSVSVERVSMGQRRRLAEGWRVELSVKVNKPGRVSVRGTARLGKGRPRTVLSGSVRTNGAGKAKLPVRLSSVARARLSKSARLRVMLVVRFGGVSDARAVSLVLPRQNGGRGR